MEAIIISLINVDRVIFLMSKGIVWGIKLIETSLICCNVLLGL
jgi:hypothetical protein